MLITSRGVTKQIVMIVGRAVYYKTMRLGMPIGESKKMTKEQFEKWANHQSKFAKAFDGEKLMWSSKRNGL